jgi:hypothetical protein
MTDSRFDHLSLRDLSAALSRDASGDAPQLDALRLSGEDCAAAAVTIRLATPADAGALTRLAELDSQPVPPGSVLIAEVCERPIAALSLTGRSVIADPFLPTIEVVELLKLRADQIGPPRSAGLTRRVARLLATRRPRTA